MGKLCNPELCTGCGACAAVCSANCIRMTPDAEGFLRPEADMQTCVNCGRCEASCPVLNRQPANEKTTAVAAVNTNEQERCASTSGGVFSLLSRWVLAHGGIVFGAAYDADYQVVHRAVEDPAEIACFRGAKYSQSELGDTYRQVRSCLEADRYVLFSGTPCQVGGLVSFLNQKHDKLFLVDLICHGVPSPKVWEHYIDYRSRMDANGQRPVEINLRSKAAGWPGYSIQFKYPGNITYSALNSQDPYLRGFVGNLYLRPSCYECHYKGIERQSDITLGDYWGVWNQHPDYHDGKGTSLVLLHSEKGREIWNDISSGLSTKEVDVLTALTDNPSALVSSAYTPKRDVFFEKCPKQDFTSLINELCPVPVVKKRTLLQRVAGRLKRLIKG